MNSLVLSAALLAGLGGSLHCLAMCGGIAVALNADAPPRAAFWSALKLNLGRILGYTFAGALVGVIGVSFLQLFQAQTWTFHVRLLVGVAMLMIAVRLLDVRQKLAWLSAPGRWMWTVLQKLQAPIRLLPLPLRAPASGLLWAFLPCGLSSTMLMAAWFEADLWRSAAIMLAFGIGTLPAMTAVAWSGQRSMALLQRPGWRIGAAAWIATVGLVTLTSPWLAGLHPVLPGALKALGCVVDQ
ncbi:MAG: sulfite exporter TauE/SafE family protein [Ahniella sp.]|nr:sulfite exporter TauE/SafE family protein [Ahniella sp.]